MKVEKIHVYEVSRPFAFRFKSGNTSRTISESIILQLDFDNGLRSYGESAPRPYVTGETLDSVAGLIINCFAKQLLGREIASQGDVENILSEIEDLCRKQLIPYCSAIGAVDIALLDGLGQLQGYPVAHYLGIGREAIVSKAISIPLLPDEAIQNLFVRFRNYNFQHIKVLVGSDVNANIKRLLLVKSLFGDGVEIRIEANGKWNYEQALQNLRSLKKYQIVAVEQPLSSYDIDGLRRLREQISIQVIADESMCTLSDAMNLIANEACDIINIKISKCGGLLKSKAIANFARAKNIPCQLGSHVGETEILTAAGRHFSATTPLNLVEGNFSFLLFKDHSDTEALPLPSPAIEGAGLGLSYRQNRSAHWQLLYQS